MIEHRELARLLVREIKAGKLVSGAASRCFQLPMTHHNLTYEALHPTAYSFVRSSLRFRRRVILVVSLLRDTLLRVIL